MASYYSGRVHSVVFENASQDFYILRMHLDESNGSFLSIPSSNVSVRGNVPGIKVCIGTWFGFEAKWHNHSKYGKQLVITKAPVIKTWSPEVACSILASNGVSERICNGLLSQFGDNLITILDLGDPDALRDVPGMTPFAAAHVLRRWQSSKAYFQTLDFLSEVGIPRGRVSQVWSTFEGKAEEVLSRNPWALVRIDGITFKQADEVALRLGLDLDSPQRREGAVLFACKTQRGMGHLYMSTGELYSSIQRILPSTTREIAEAIASLHREGILVLDGDTKQGTKAIYEPWIFHLEQKSTQLLLERLTEASLVSGTETYVNYVRNLASIGGVETTDLSQAARSALQDWSRGSNLVLTGNQLEGAYNALVEPVSIITGLPGTGKSTLIRAVVRVMQDASVSFLLVAPTGIAAKRISSLTGASASTIHRGFGAHGLNMGEQRESSYVGIVGDSAGTEQPDGSGEVWKCSQRPHHADVVICDEASMVDQHLLYRILECTRSNTRLVFVGDAAQLPSVGPGNVLRDLINTGLFPTVSLTEIFRQEETSDIVKAAHAIHSGEVPSTTSDATSDFILLPCHSEERVLEVVVGLADRLYKKRKNFQVMSPRHGGTLGVTNLNMHLRMLLNPQQPGLQEMRIGSEVIREDDRVMVVKNNYRLDIFNGDVGKVARIDRKSKIVHIKIHGPPTSIVGIQFKDASTHLRLAYAVTVHKMQGQEVSTIVMPLVKSFSHQLQRNLLYTAITRAKERVYMVGHPDALARAVSNNKRDYRNTLFSERLRRAFVS